MGIPDPRNQLFDPAPVGTLRVVAWRHQTPTWPHPDLEVLHTERAALLHWWADAYNLDVDNWGATDAERPSEFVEVLLDIGQETLRAALGALATGFVQYLLKRRKTKAAKKPPADQDPDSAAPPPPDVRPLMGLTIINQSGGTVVVLNPARPDEVSRLLERVTNPKWRGNEIVF